MNPRRDPFAEMDRMFEQMRRTMMGMRPDDAHPMIEGDDRAGIDRFGGRSGDLGRSYDDPARSGTDFGRPGMDVNLTVESDDEGYVVLADLPGFERDEIDLRVDGDALMLAAEREVSEDREGLSTRRHRSVRERMTLPSAVVEDQVTATYRNGVLEIHLPVEGDGPGDGHRIDIE